MPKTYLTYVFLPNSHKRMVTKILNSLWNHEWWIQMYFFFNSQNQAYVLGEKKEIVSLTDSFFPLLKSSAS